MDEQTFGQWLAQYGGRSSLLEKHEEDHATETINGYQVDTRRLQPWFTRTIEQNDLYDDIETIYRTDESDTFVRYRRRIVHRDESFGQTARRLFRPGEPLLGDGYRFILGMGVLTGLFSVPVFSELMIVSGAVVGPLFSIAFCMIVLPLLPIIGEYGQIPGAGPTEKKLSIESRSELQELLQDEETPLPDELQPRTLQGPES